MTSHTHNLEVNSSFLCCLGRLAVLNVWATNGQMVWDFHIGGSTVGSTAQVITPWGGLVFVWRK